MKCDFQIYKTSEEVVWIIDNNSDGKMSVTNDAEAVCEYLNALFPERRIMYKDSMGNWDELLHDGGKFIDFKFGGPIP